jgi:hypothetical protein
MMMMMMMMIYNAGMGVRVENTNKRDKGNP